jgi:beta-N-acetylhexosaminidase
VLVSDDLDMRALSGALPDLARQALAAGCDLVLHCTGEIMETEALLAECPLLSDGAADRMRAARAAAVAQRLDAAALAAERDALMACDDG